MTNAGPTIAGTGTDDSSSGTYTWSNPSYITANDSNLASATSSAGTACSDAHVYLLVGGTRSGTDLAGTAGSIGASEAVMTYGGTSNLWGNSLTPADVNSSTFGVSFMYALASTGSLSHYLNATNFGFSIPTGATINGVTVYTDCYQYYGPGQTSVYVNYVEITVTYTNGGTVTGVSSITGISSLAGI